MIIGASSPRVSLARTSPRTRNFAPDSWGARGAECLPCDVPRRSSPATSSRDGTTARRCLCHGTGSGTTEARPPASSVPPAPHGVWGVVAPRGQSRAGFSEQQFIILILARKDEPTLDYPRKDELTPDYPRAPTLAATPQQQQRAQDPDESFPKTSPVIHNLGGPLLVESSTSCSSRQLCLHTNTCWEPSGVAAHRVSESSEKRHGSSGGDSSG